MMTFWNKIWERVTVWRRPAPPARLEERLCWVLRPCLSSLEDLLLWKNPSASFGFLLFVNLLVWVLRVSNVRVLGLVGWVCVFTVVLDAAGMALGAGKGAAAVRARRRVSQDRPPAPRLTEALQTTERHLSAVYNYFRELRDNNHSKFCSVVCACIVSAWLVVQLGGALLVHGLLSAALLAPLAPPLTPISQHTDSDGEMEGFLPEMSLGALQELQRAGEQPPEPLSLVSDLSLPPPDEVAGALRYATGEASSSEGEGAGNSPVLDLSTSDSTDSESEFLLHDKKKKRPGDEGSGWLSPAARPSAAPLRPSAPPLRDSDSDEFELIDRDDL